VTRPHTYLIRMLVFLAFVAGGCVMLVGPLSEFFSANAFLNGLIVSVLVLGIIYNFRQVIRLYPEVGWIESYRQALDENVLRATPTGETHHPKLLAPMATMVSNRDKLSLAFSSSLFGLAGSLVLGFLDLQAGQAQNRFYNDLEEWLSSVTRLSSGGLISDGEQSVPAYVQALLEQTAESLENLQRTMARGEDSRSKVDDRLHALTAKLETLTDQMRTEQALMKSLAETQVAIRPILQQLAEGASGGGAGLDEGTRAHIRNMDLQISGMREEARHGREGMLQELRSEIKLLARTLAAASEDRR
jgi:hypothetical protein